MAARRAALRKWQNQDLILTSPRPPSPPLLLDTTTASSSSHPGGQPVGQLTLPSRVVVRSRGLVADTEQQELQQREVCWPVILGVCIIQAAVPSLLWSHGVYAAHLLINERSSAGAAILLPPAVFSATWAFIEPWCRAAGQRHRGRDGRLLAGCGSLLLAMSLAASALSQNSIARTLTFGLLGGAGCGMASAQCDAQLGLHVTARRRALGVGASLAAQALGTFLAPLVLVGLLAAYGLSGAPLLQAALALHGLAGALLLRVAPRGFSAPRPDTNTNGGIYLPLLVRGPVADCSEVPEAVSSARELEVLGEEEVAGGDGRTRNHLGVEIMPQILEEDELQVRLRCRVQDLGLTAWSVQDMQESSAQESSQDSSEEEEEDAEETDLFIAPAEVAGGNRQSISRPTSWVPVAPLELYLPLPEDSQVQGTSPKPLLTPSSLSSRRAFNFERGCCCGCRSGPCSRCRAGLCACCLRALAALAGSANKLAALITKCGRDLRTLWHPSLLPCLAMASSARLVPLGLTCLAPPLAQLTLRLPRHEAAFVLAVFGFGWLCAAVCSPCILAPAARSHVPLLYTLATALSATGLYIVGEAQSHDSLTLGCVCAGVAHGVLLQTGPLLLRARGKLSIGAGGAAGTALHALLDRGSALVTLIAAIIACAVTMSVSSYGLLLRCLAGLQACIAAGWMAWLLVLKVRGVLNRRAASATHSPRPLRPRLDSEVTSEIEFHSIVHRH